MWLKQCSTPSRVCFIPIVLSKRIPRNQFYPHWKGNEKRMFAEPDNFSVSTIPIKIKTKNGQIFLGRVYQRLHQRSSCWRLSRTWLCTRSKQPKSRAGDFCRSMLAAQVSHVDQEGETSTWPHHHHLNRQEQQQHRPQQRPRQQPQQQHHHTH